jgi:hypothetical protein
LKDSPPPLWLTTAHTVLLPKNKNTQIAKNYRPILHLNGNDKSITSELIQIMKGIYQGDSLSVLLFVLALNPLSFLLRSTTKGYAYGKNRLLQHTHNFFVDDLKLFATNTPTIKKQLDLITTFSRDIGMSFGEDKCAYLQIEKGKLITSQDPIVINQLTIQPIAEGDCYRYLGIDENISYNGPINKERVTKEYLNRVRKIWSSELSDRNKVIAHNSFAVPILTPTIGIIDWTIQEINQLDIKTRKSLTIANSFHPNSDIDTLYMSRTSGGRGLKRIQTLYEGRIISIRQHLIRNDNTEMLKYVTETEKNSIMRVGQELLSSKNVTEDAEQKPKAISRTFTSLKMKEHEQRYVNKKKNSFRQFGATRR